MHSKLLCDVVIIFVHVPPGGIKSARVVKQKHTEGAGGKQVHVARQKKEKLYIYRLSRFSAHVWKRAGTKRRPFYIMILSAKTQKVPPGKARASIYNPHSFHTLAKVRE